VNLLNITTLSALSSFNIKTDRILSDDISLPYDKYDLYVKPNTPITNISFNKTLKKIHNNLMYVMSRSYIANTNIPINKGRLPLIISVSGNNDSYIEHSSGTKNKSTSNLISTIATPNIIKGTVGIITASHNNVMLGTLSSDRSTGILHTSPRQLYSSRLVSEDKKSSKEFTNIKSISYSDNNLYVLDLGIDKKSPILHSYNVMSITRNDSYVINSYTKGRRHTASIGGLGVNVEEKANFKNPQFVSSSDSSVYVVDFEDNTALGGYIKEYDTSLNFIGLHDLTVHFNKYTPVDIIQNKNDLLILSNGPDNRGYIIIYDKNKKRVTGLTALEKTITDRYTSISQSATDDNILYITTRKQVIKKFKSRLDNTIGIFDHYEGNLTSNTYTNVCSLPSGTIGHDEIFIGATTGMYIFDKESPDYQSTLYSDTDSGLYPIESIMVKPEEFVNHFVFNKIFHKMIYNHYIIRENLRMIFAENDAGTLDVQYIDHSSTALNNLYNYKEDINNYIGINEPITTSVINRCIEEIYDLQVLLLEAIKTVTPEPVDREAVLLA
jgi:hypothetical protein